VRRIRLLYGLLDRLSARGVVACLDAALERDRMDPGTLEAYSRSRLEALLDHCRREVPFYRERLDRVAGDARSLAREAFASIPVLEKREIAAAGERLVARGGPAAAGRGRATTVTSGGTTGPPVRLLIDAEAHDAQTAATIRSFLWFGADPTRRHALLWGPPPEDNSYASFGGRLRGLILRRTLLPTFALDEAGARAHWLRLSRLRLDFVAGYSSALVRIAAARRGDERCRVRSGVVAAAEPLFDFQRAPLERAFGAPVRERYGCNEHALLAQECDRGGLHVATDRVRLEIVREDGSPAAAGEVGTVLVTDLDSRLMPIVRYRLGDLAAWRAGSCPCGRPYPLLERVHGRCRDALRSAAGALLTPHDFAAGLVGRPVRAFQLVAREDRRPAEVRLVGEPFAVESVAERWRAMAGGPLDVRFVGELARSLNGKILPVVDAVPTRGAPA